MNGLVVQGPGFSVRAVRCREAFERYKLGCTATSLGPLSSGKIWAALRQGLGSLINNDLQRRATMAHETAHGAVAESFGMEVYELCINWEGHPICRYRGQCYAGMEHMIEGVIALAGPIGEQLVLERKWRLDDEFVEDMCIEVRERRDELQLERPDDLTSAVNAAQKQLKLSSAEFPPILALIREWEQWAHTKLTTDAIRARWIAMRRQLAG